MDKEALETSLDNNSTSIKIPIYAIENKCTE